MKYVAIEEVAFFTIFVLTFSTELAYARAKDEKSICLVSILPNMCRIQVKMNFVNL